MKERRILFTVLVLGLMLALALGQIGQSGSQASANQARMSLDARGTTFRAAASTALA